MVRQETWPYSTWFGNCSIHYAYNVSTSWCFQVWLYCSYLCTYQYIIPTVSSLSSTVVIYVLININNQIFQNVEAYTACIRFWVDLNN